MGAESLISSRLFQPVFPCEFRLHGLSHHSNCVAGCVCELTCGLVSHFCSFCFCKTDFSLNVPLDGACTVIDCMFFSFYPWARTTGAKPTFFERVLGRNIHRYSLCLA